MITMIPRSRLEPHPDNPRKDLGDLTELAASIKRSGLLQNLTVVPSPGDPEKYRIIIGHRRFAASEIAGLDELPCSIEEMDMPTQIATMIAENMQRNDLTLTDQVGGIQTMMDLGIDAKGIAERTGLSTTTVRKRMKLTGINPGLLADTVQKGATLMDLAEIANLDDDLRDQMLSEFGSTSFTWKMNQARETQKARKNIPKVREALSQWAKEVDQQPWNIYREACSHERSVELLHINENELKRPDAPQDTEFVFYINGSRCTVYRIGDKASAQMHEEQQRREQACNIIRTQELDVATTAKNLRDAFIKGYAGREQDKTPAFKFATYVLLHQGYMRPAELPRWRDLCGSAGKDGKHLTDEDRAVIDVSPLKAMVQAAYQKWDSSGSEHPQRCTSWRGEYERDDDLIAVYNYLAALGYQIADEEWAWLLGTHECYILPDGTTLPKEDDEE